VDLTLTLVRPSQQKKITTIDSRGKDIDARWIGFSEDDAKNPPEAQIFGGESAS
jgi:hypothetical protein